MNFYRRRPLALAVSLGMLILAAASVMPGFMKPVLILLSAAVAPLAVYLFRRLGINTVATMPSGPFVVLSAVVIMCLLLVSWAYINLYAEKYDRAFEAEIEGIVVEQRQTQSYCASYVVRLKTIDGQAVNARGLMYTEYAMGMSAGDCFTAHAVFMPLEEYYDAGIVTTEDMLADGFVFTCETDGEVSYDGTAATPEVLLSKFRSMLKAILSLYVDDDTAALSKALLLGDRTDLGKIRRDFTNVGAGHLLAVSGLHLSILCGMLSDFLTQLRMNRPLRGIFVIVFIIMAMVLLGFPASLTRAGIMLIIAYAAMYLGRQYDSITALFAAAFLILFLNPTAIYDQGFALSVTATLAMILFTTDAVRLLRGVFGTGRRALSMRRFLISLISCVGMQILVIPLQWLYFGELSLLAVPATLILAPICEAMLMLLPVYLICGLIRWHFMCGRIGWLIAVCAEAIERAAGWMAELTPLISLRYPFVPVLIVLFTVVVIGMMVRNYKYWFYTLIPYVAALLLFLGCVRVWEMNTAGRVFVDYIGDETEESFIVTAGNQYMVVDMSSGTRSMVYRTVDVLKKCGGTEINTYLLTHIHRKHINGVRKLLEHRTVRTIAAPCPVDEYEQMLLEELRACLRPYKTELILYSRENENDVIMGGVTLRMTKYDRIKRSVHPMISLRFSANDAELVYCCGSAWESTEAWSLTEDAACMILGQHGPLYKGPPEALREGAVVFVSPSHPMAGDSFVNVTNGIVQRYVLVP